MELEYGLTINWLQPDDTSFEDGQFDDLVPLFPVDYSLSPSIGLASPAHVTGLEFSSILPASETTALQSISPVADEEIKLTYTSPVTDSSTLANKFSVEKGHYYVDGDAGRLPRSKRRKIVARPCSAHVTDEPGLSLQNPPLTIACTQANLLLSPKIYGKLRFLYQQLCLESTIFKAYKPSELPSKQALESLLARYFAQFGQTMPFLHEPTLTSVSRHCALLLAMMALGSCFIDGEQLEVFTRSMHEFVRRLLILVDEDDSWRPPNAGILAQTQLLFAIGVRYTLCQPLRAFTTQSLRSATEYCRDKWRRQDYAHYLESHDNSILSPWKAWVAREESLRTGFCVWLVDCMWAYQFLSAAP